MVLRRRGVGITGNRATSFTTRVLNTADDYSTDATVDNMTLSLTRTVPSALSVEYKEDSDVLINAKGGSFI